MAAATTVLPCGCMANTSACGDSAAQTRSAASRGSTERSCWAVAGSSAVDGRWSSNDAAGRSVGRSVLVAPAVAGRFESTVGGLSTADARRIAWADSGSAAAECSARFSSRNWIKPEPSRQSRSKRSLACDVAMPRVRSEWASSSRVMWPSELPSASWNKSMTRAWLCASTSAIFRGMSSGAVWRKARF